ncbi:hypothetical protein SAMN00768000_1421 [Sulfobacillus thermosulfidooxidans DSM 9293]|uniref:Uncharacterized protein n=1 Tax=Sulfobacillus thermosulfidooxidans (strain DSM 9293 / VKM B-1269 / AT-1) TaxID=929705 RepID=A0A1W1WCK7_SULTA|nr:hypothetical protein SAMN00768000_1421 [Sulfobacillus thermosulfidooxidans DSM 9293]
MRVTYPVCPECGNRWVGRLTAPGWFFCSTCTIEFKYDVDGLIVYNITPDGMRKRAHRRRRRPAVQREAYQTS